MTGSTTAAAQAASRLHFPRVYEGYAYSYPHKSAYGPLEPPVPLREAWSAEQRGRITLYIHVPFCGMRCGFCNLFTMANPKRPLIARYLNATGTQAEVAAEELGDAAAARFVIGGGTPTFLEADDLARLLDLAARLFGADPARVPTAIETSPGTACPEKLALLAARGVERISIGAQSFSERERCAMGRPQKRPDLEAALDAIRDARFPVLNIDLIYGASGQTPESWRQSLRRALLWRPEEVHLYPLYVRPLTGLDGKAGVETWDAHRLSLYRAGRDFLLGEGYEQRSMRLFRRSGVATRDASPEFASEDGAMLGLGPAARSATARLHYSSRYAVSRRGVLAVLDAYCNETADAFRYAHYGVELDADSRMRRFVLQSILRTDGLDAAAFSARFGAAPLDALPALAALKDAGLLEDAHGRLRLTPAGSELSDAIGPRLYSPRIRERMAAALQT